MTRHATIRNCLAVGACTAPEVSLITGIPLRAAQIGLYWLRVTKQVTKAGIHEEGVDSIGRPRKLIMYALTGHGHRMHKRQ